MQAVDSQEEMGSDRISCGTKATVFSALVNPLVNNTVV